MIRIAMVLLLALFTGCSHALTDDAVLLIESSDDVDLVDGALENFRPHIKVGVTVTTDAKLFHNWGTDERWRVITTNGGEFIDGGVLCRKGQTEPGTVAVTERAEKTIWVGPCIVQDAQRLFVLAHEIGHMVGAEHCETGVMKAWDPTTLELSDPTKRELHELYNQ